MPEDKVKWKKTQFQTRLRRSYQLDLPAVRI